MKENIFPILAFATKNPSDYSKERKDSGTGFFINKEGVFISAGHVFKNETYYYYAMINGDIYPIEYIYMEYLEQREQQFSEYHDLYIGKISLGKDTISIPMACDLEVNTELCPNGYSKLFLLSTQQPKQSLDDLFDIDDYEPEEYNPNPSNDLRWYGDDFFSFQLISETMKIRKDEFAPEYNNGFSIDMKGTSAHGLSGGPVISNGSVRGMLVAENNCISSKYIISKLKEHDIQLE